MGPSHFCGMSINGLSKFVEIIMQTIDFYKLYISQVYFLYKINLCQVAIFS
uniref:Uncharacterized protein n=1 Tax=Arundo donax TaxID=35708 RepID=A0A0A9E184_ARUDO